MEIFILLLFGLPLIIIAYKIARTSRYKATANTFQQAGVKVIFDEGKIIINGKTYSVNDVQGLEWQDWSRISKRIIIKVDDLHYPLHKIGIMGFNDAGGKFVQRLSTALRKAGGPSFY